MIDCPECGSSHVESVEIRGNADSPVIVTHDDELDDGDLLQLCYCNGCSSGIERILTEQSKHIIP